MNILKRFSQPEPVKEPKKRRKHTRTNATGEQNRNLVMELVKEKGGALTYRDVMTLGIKESASYAYLTALVKEGKLKIDDSTNPRSYCLVEVDVEDLYDSRTKTIIDYAAEHAGEHFSIDQMARDIEIPNSTTHYMVKALVRKGLLNKGFNKGGRNFVSTTEPTPVPPVESQEQDALFSQIEFLTWTFVRETRTTDILAFLTWLEARSK